MNHCLIHYNCTHSNQHIIVQRTAMYNCIMRNRDIIAYYSFSRLIRAMNNCPILNIGIIINGN